MGNSTHTLFINTRKEAKIAAEIAQEHGFEILTEDMFYKRYIMNVFAPWSSQDETRQAKKEIVSAVLSNRAFVARNRGKSIKEVAARGGVSAKAETYEDVQTAIEQQYS